VDFGLAIFDTDETIAPVKLARLAEDAGFESLWFPEHSHIPASRETPYPAGGDLPPEYWRMNDPFVALAAVAAVTERLRVATGICLVIQRDPIQLAKQVATLDHLSGGRFVFGIGAGWNLEEMRNHGTDPERRFGRLRESVEAMREIWANDEASYHGDQIDFDPIWAWPKPVQQPSPPILLGGNGRQVLDRVLRVGTGWLPNHLGDDEKLVARIGKLKARGREEQDRDVPVTVYGAPPEVSAYELYEQAGVERIVYWLPPAPEAKVEQVLERHAASMREYRDAGG
jgi:probable F420-dependent oxidoreductase